MIAACCFTVHTSILGYIVLPLFHFALICYEWCGCCYRQISYMISRSPKDLAAFNVLLHPLAKRFIRGMTNELLHQASSNPRDTLTQTSIYIKLVVLPFLHRGINNTAQTLSRQGFSRCTPILLYIFRFLLFRINVFYSTLRSSSISH